FLYLSDDNLDLHSFPTRRSSDLLLSPTAEANTGARDAPRQKRQLSLLKAAVSEHPPAYSRDSCINSKSRCKGRNKKWKASQSFLDRKSTRLNSSHVKISYAVFCL